MFSEHDLCHFLVEVLTVEWRYYLHFFRTSTALGLISCVILFGGYSGYSGDILSILMVEVFFFFLLSSVVCLPMTTCIPRPSLRLDSIGLSLLVKELAALGHNLLSYLFCAYLATLFSFC